MRYEAAPCKLFDGEWIVEAINLDGDGEVYAARFSGPLAEDRAREYAAWKNFTGNQLEPGRNSYDAQAMPWTPLIDGVCPHCGKEGPILGLYEYVGGHGEVLRFRCAKQEADGRWVWDSTACWGRWDSKRPEFASGGMVHLMEAEMPIEWEAVEE